MERLTGVLQMILPVPLMLGVGMLCRKKRIVQKQGAEGIKAIVINVCVPAVMLRAFYNTAFGAGMAMAAAAMFVCSALALGAGFAFARLARAPRIAPFLLTSFEGGMLGYALFTLLFGTGAITDFATVDLGQALFVWTIYFSLLRRDQTGERGTLLSTLRAMAASPITVAIALGITLGASGLGPLVDASAAGGVVAGILDFAAAPTAAVILFVVGYDLKLSRQSLKAALPAVLARITLMALLCAAVLLGLGALTPLPPTLQWAFVLIFLMPPTYCLPVLARDEDDSAYATAALSIHTVFTLAAFTAIAFILGRA